MPLHAFIKIISQYKYTLFEDICNTQEHYFLMKSIKLQDSFYKYHQNQNRTQQLKEKRERDIWQYRKEKERNNRQKKKWEQDYKTDKSSI